MSHSQSIKLVANLKKFIVDILEPLVDFPLPVPPVSGKVSREKGEPLLLFNDLGKLQASLEQWNNQILSTPDFTLLVWQLAALHCRFELQQLVAQLVEVFLVVLRLVNIYASPHIDTNYLASCVQRCYSTEE